MKNLLILSLVLASSFATAEIQRTEIQCLDPSLFQYFDTEEEAIKGCPVAKNVYVTYDHGFKKYTCGCTNPDNGNGE